jgi:predicted membrane protein
MDTIKNRDETCDVKWKQYRHTPAGKIAAGIWVVLVGAVLLSRQFGVEYPSWLFTWPVLLMAIGIYISARHLFCNPGGYILIVIGGVFLLDMVTPDVRLSTYIWPVVIIAAGLLMIFKSNKRKKYVQTELEDAYTKQWKERAETRINYPNDTIETVAIFGGVKKNVLSKNFMGGEVTCVLGGAEINLLQADINGRVELEVNCILGGTKLIIPSNWDVQPEMVAVLGGIEDKRQMHTAISPDKVLILKGTSILGGIEIKSF